MKTGCKPYFVLIHHTILQRFGSAITPDGLLHLSKKTYEKDYQPIDKDCLCSTCANYTRAYLHSIIHEPVSCSLITVHNVAYQVGKSSFLHTNLSIQTFKQRCVCETLMPLSNHNPTLATMSKVTLASIH